MIEQYFADLTMDFESKSNPEIATGAKAYMRNIFAFYGIPSPLRRQLLKEFLAKAGNPPYEKLEEMVQFAWGKPQREWQYVAMEIVGKSLNTAGPELINLAEWMITHKSWWDSVDYIAPNIAGMLFKKFPEIKIPTIESWMQSDHLWLQRACLIHQLRYKNTTDAVLLFDLCGRLADHPDFFIRKAIGWSLRQYSKFAPEAVIEFVNDHKLSNLSRKEALKVINR